MPGAGLEPVRPEGHPIFKSGASDQFRHPRRGQRNAPPPGRIPCAPMPHDTGINHDIAVALSVLGVVGQVLVGLGIIVGLLALVGVRGPLNAVRNLLWGYELWAAFIVAAVATGGSLFYSQVAGAIPCEFCWFQRVLMYPLSILTLLIAVRGDATAGRRAISASHSRSSKRRHVDLPHADRTRRVIEQPSRCSDQWAGLRCQLADQGGFRVSHDPGTLAFTDRFLLLIGFLVLASAGAHPKKPNCPLTPSAHPRRAVELPKRHRARRPRRQRGRLRPCARRACAARARPRPRALAIATTPDVVLVVIIAIVLGGRPLERRRRAARGSGVNHRQATIPAPARDRKSDLAGCPPGRRRRQTTSSRVPTARAEALGDPRNPVTMEDVHRRAVPVLPGYETTKLPTIVTRVPPPEGKVRLRLKPWAFLGGALVRRSFSGRLGLIAASPSRTRASSTRRFATARAPARPEESRLVERQGDGAHRGPA